MDLIIFYMTFHVYLFFYDTRLINNVCVFIANYYIDAYEILRFKVKEKL